MTQTGTTEHDKLRQTYHAVFNTPAGRAVLRDLNRVANLTRINSDDPNCNAALYKVAQQDLVRRMEKMANVRPDQD